AIFFSTSRAASFSVGVSCAAAVNGIRTTTHSASERRIMGRIIVSALGLQNPAALKRKSLSVAGTPPTETQHTKMAGDVLRSLPVRLPLALLLAGLVSIAGRQPVRPITAAGVDSAAADDPYRITTVCTVAPVNTGRRVPVSNGAELQRALDAAS